MKAVLISIHPKWCELIARGKKTIEVRKTRPKIETPFKCYIYCSGGRGKQATRNGNEIGLFRWNGVRLIKQKVDAGWVKDIPEQTWQILLDYGFTHQLHDDDYELNGKIIGSFVCDRIEKISYNEDMPYDGYEIEDTALKETCLTLGDLDCYGNKKLLYGWHISDLKIYDKPKELREFCAYCKKEKEEADEDCKGCSYVFKGTTTGEIYCDRVILRPPQSWQFVEELE